jgi:hypothetical protein
MPISLHFMEHLTIREVADAMALPEKTVRSQIARGIEQVRQALTTSGFAIAVPAIPALLASAELPSAPAALAGAIKLTIAHSAAKGAAASTSAAVSGTKGAAALTAKIAVPAFLAASMLAAVLHFAGGNKSAPTVGAAAPAAPLPIPAPTPVTQADAPPVENKNLTAILAQKVDVNYWRDYPSEVLTNLKCQTGLLYALYW